MKIVSNATLIGNHRILLNEVGSTQDFASDLLKWQPSLHGTVILAHAQKNGRGRMTKKWESNDGENFTGSIIIQAPGSVKKDNYGIISMFTALAVQESISKTIDNEVKIKWPNDILVSNKKVAGILIHNQWRSQNLASAVLGIGVNLNQTIFPDHISQASSLKIISQLHIDKGKYIELLMETLNKWYSILKEGDTNTILSAYHHCLFGDKELIRFEVNGAACLGKIIEVSLNGMINIVSLTGKNEWYDIDQVKIEY
jgi:BirA family transcriptional regulator, biotin operon repressor / biotin---[acetyl-CoA-carboxylase] ligase